LSRNFQNKGETKRKEREREDKEIPTDGEESIFFAGIHLWTIKASYKRGEGTLRTCKESIPAVLISPRDI